MWKHASINRAYRLVWNRVQQAFVPAPETARGHGAGSAVARSSRASACLPPRAHPRWRLLSLALAGAFLAHPALALDAGALPTGGSVAAGAANITGSGNALTITQDSDRAIVNWQSFDVGTNASVRFVQPSTTAATLNRVTGSGASQILGTMTANGQVYLVNPAGVLFGASAQVNVGSLVASTLRLADADFLAGRDRFTLDGATGEVSNQGRITAADGGRVALLGARVSNTGTILAPLGDVALAAGRQITLAAGANGHLQIAVDPADVATLASNGGLIQADGGQVVLTAQGANALASAVVSNTGTVQARTVATREGRILLLADQDRGGTTKVAGMLDASAPQGGNGGFIETSAARVTVAAGTTVTTRAGNGKTGTWLIDPNDFTIAAADGDMTGADVSAALQSTDFEIQSVRGGKSGKGDIFVNDTVNWRANTLTLTAERDIQINAAMNGSEAAGLALRYGQGAPAANNAATYQVRAPVNLTSKGRFSTRLGNDGPTLDYIIITHLGEQGSRTSTDLQGINGDLSGRYVLGSDIDASATRGWNYGKGFEPLEGSGDFTGIFDGLGHVISELTINRPSQSYVGLFSAANNAAIRHVGLDGVSVEGKDGVGGLVGQFASDGSGKARIDNVWVTGNVKGQGSFVGGLVGYNKASAGGTIDIDNTWTSGAVSGTLNVGGLIGFNTGDNGTANISNAHASGAVTGQNSVGGLIGVNSANNGATVSIGNAYATGNVTTGPGQSLNVGGLVGLNSAKSGGTAKISNAYATGTVKGNNLVGGLVGLNQALRGGGTASTGTASIRNAYATGAVTGGASVGGLVGSNEAIEGSTASISNAYATGAVEGNTNVGGLAGYNNNTGGTSTASISNSYATGAVTGSNLVGGFVGWNARGTVRDSYWDRHSTQQDEGNGRSSGILTNLLWVTSDPAQSDAAEYAFKVGAYANLGTVATSKKTDAGWYMIEGQTRPFLASEYTTTVTNAHQLQLMAMDLGANYTLARNIDARATGLNNGTADRSGGMWTGAGFSPIGSDIITPFTGTFDGQGHVISGLTINRPSQNHVGLFGRATNAAILHVGLDGGSVSGNAYVGGLVGQFVARDDGTASLDNVWVTGNVKGQSNYIGGLVGHNAAAVDSTASIDNAYATGDVTGQDQSDYVGGLVGYNYAFDGTASIRNVYATGTVEGNDRVGGLVGGNVGTIEDAWASGNVTGKTNVGSLMGTQWGSIHNSGYRLTGDRSISASEGDVNLLGGVVQGDGVTGQTLSVKAGRNANLGDIQLPDNHLSLNVAGDITAPDKVVVGGFTLDRGNWRQVATLTELPTFSASDFRLAGGTFVRANGGDGSAAATPYLLTDVYGLQGMGTLLSGRFTLANDIDASGTATWNSGAGFTPVGGNGFYFIGSLDGQDHAISGLVIDRPGVSYIGLFGNANNASISNLSLQGGKITGSNYTGALAGAFSGTLTNVRSGVDVDGGDFTGGLVGRIWYGANNHVSDVWTTGDVAGGDRVGGLAGWNGQGTIRNAGASGKVSGTTDVGGLVGLNDGSASIIGGSASGTVEGVDNVGGLVGWNWGKGTSSNIENSYATGDVTGTGSNTGGLVGYNSGSIWFNADESDSLSVVYASGKVSGVNNVGGLVGLNAGSASLIKNASARGDVVGSGSGAGGLVGRNEGAIDASVAFGIDVSGVADVGSLAGTWAGGTSLNSAYTLFQNDHSISASNGNVNLLGTVIQSGNASGRTLSVTASGGNASLDSIALSGNNLSLDISGDITAAGAIEIGGFTLNRGHWRQVSAALPTFSASDFRLAGGTFVRATDGDGSAATPYLLTDVYGLQGMGTLLSGHFALAGDIDASGTAKWNDRAGFSPIGRDGITPFTGTFDGQDHVISGLTIDRPNQDFVGLFGVAQNARILHVGLDDAKITGKSSVGALVGQLFATNSDTASIDNAWASGTVNGFAYVGGLVGVNAAISGTARISNSHATGAVTGLSKDQGEDQSNHVGGLVGVNVAYSGSASIRNAHATGAVEGNDRVGGLVGGNDGTIEDAWASGHVTGKTNVGSLMGTQWGSIHNSGYRLTGDRSISASEGDINLLGGVVQGDGVTGQTLSVTAGGNASLGTIQLPDNHLSLDVAGDITAPDKVEVGGFTLDRGNWRQVATLTELPTFSARDFRLAGGTFVRATGGDGSATTPYLLSDVYGLQGMGTLLSGHFALAGNIDASHTAGWNEGAGFSPIGRDESAPFTGTLDGQSHVISGLTIYRPNQDLVGLFSAAENASIRNVGLDNANVTGSGDVGALVGQLRATNNGTASIDNAWASGTVNGVANVGGLVGSNQADEGSTATISNVHATGTVTGKQHVGGLVGVNVAIGGTSRIRNAQATGAVTGLSEDQGEYQGDYVGGLVGINVAVGGTASISNAYATGAVTGNGKVGGLVGANDALIGTASISNAYATGAVEGNDRIGGLVGSNGGTIEDTWASGDVSGATNVGSLVGQGENASLIRSSYVLTDDRSISASEGDINLLGGVTQDAGTSGRTLTVKAGGNANLGAIQLPDNHLNLDIAGNITAADAVTVDRYTLNAGHWRQIGTLPALSARDFRLAGGTFVRATDGDGSAATPYLLTDVYGLQGMGTLLSGHFALAGDIDASGTAKWNDRAGFSPIGRDGITPFKGTFDGRHHVISGLTINRHGQEFVGLFGAAQNATIRNVGLDDANITGNSNVGALVGQLKATNSDTASIDNAWASGTVNGSASVGGLVGVNIANGGTASINNAHATGNVTGTGTYNFGGLVGYNYADAGGTANISSAYATGAVTGKNFVGGLAGQNVADSGSASISNAYATGTVTSNDAVTGASSAIGGLVGINHANNGGTVSISDAYATGTVEGDSNVGGLVGRNDGTVKDAWASGDVSGVTNVGSLVGTQGGSIRNSGYRLTGDRTISAARGDVNLLGGVTQGTGTSGQTLTVTATRGNASLGTIELSGNHLSLNVAGNITAPDKVEVSRYTLNAGHWRQIGTLPALPMFSASDFRLAGGTFVRATGSDGSATTPYLLTDVYGLQGMGSLLGGHFVLGGNIDAGASAAWNDGTGFAPIGSSAPFTGSLDGQGHIISNLTINTPNRSTVGLFSKLQGARISNLGLVNATVTANTGAGALAGTSRVDSVITGVYSRNGTIQGKGGLGGLVGNNLGTISNSYADGVVTGSLFTFGTGGLVGQNAGSVENSYATGTVTANSFVGGLVGTHSGGIISNSYATATVNGDGDYARGLVGSYVGGAIQDSFWNMDLAAIGVGAAPAPGASGKTGAQLMNLGTYAGWDIDSQGGTGSVWRIYDGDTMPLLRSFLKPVTVTASGMDGKVYDGTAASGTFTYTTGIADALLDGAATYGTRSANAGRYAAGLGLDTGLYSGQSGYDIIYADNTVTIDKTPLTITALDKGKVYDGLIYTGGYDVRYDGFVHGETKAALDGTLAFGGNAQEAFNAGDYTITAKDLSARNYDVRYVNGTLTIDKAPLTITANSGRSTYGDTPSNPGFTAVGLVNAQDVGVLGDLANSFGIDPTTNADEYVLTVSGTLTNGNYRVALRDGRWIVDPKAITVTANSGRSIYGDAPTNPGLTAEGLVNGQNIGVLAGLTNSFGIDHDTDAGRHTLRVDGTLTNGNYIVTERNDGTWGVDPRQIAVTANGGLSTYGDTNQINPGLTANGLVNGQDVSVLTGLTNSFGINHGTNAGSHTLRVNGTLTNGNYTVTEARDGTWIVDPAHLLITANNAIRIANGIPYQGGNGVGYTGFVNGEDASVLEGALAYGGSAQGATQPGVYGLTAGGLRSGNYRIDYRDGSLTIGVAQGMITAGQLENSAIDARYAARHDTPFGPRPSRLASLSQPDQGSSRLPLSFAENFIRVEP
ncbi:GLUG motif-containing protein [Cupriavidus basilensis]|uniref:GLUG motif-containing protein n=1 Tax=Cupriavidus basilensis TaxID=68895 RepID=UPI000751267A|nr:GLUG motif-containing protein [Cupriavidus basilensis]